MLLTQYIMTKKGDSNGILSVIVPELEEHEPRDTYISKVRSEVLAELRRDSEANRIGKYVPETNPSEDISTVEFYYRPIMQKKLFYRNQTFPIRQADGSQIEDVFVCLGSRFGLDTIQVLVEVYSDGSDRFWAIVHYVANMRAPALIIDAEKAVTSIDDKWLKRCVEAEEELQNRLREQAERFDREDAVVG